MDEHLSRGYIQLGRARNTNEFKFSKTFSNISPPVDKLNAIYVSLVLAGIGFLLPYNSFIIAVDYFQSTYPESMIIFDMSLVYIIMSFFAVLVNNVLVEVVSLNARITFGYVISFVTLLFVATFEVWWEVFGLTTSYYVNLIAVAIVAIGCTVQQSSFYGYTSMLPGCYTQAVMTGESAAGFLVSVNRVITKYLLNNQRFNTLLFFGTSAFGIAICFIIHQVVQRTDFVQFYLTLCRESKKIVLEPTEDAGLIETINSNDPSTQLRYGVLKLQSQTSLDNSNANTNTALSFANPAYEPNESTGPSYKVEDVVVKLRRSGSAGTFKVTNRSRAWNAIKRGMSIRWTVAKNIWQYMVSICAAYFVTLSLYPGIISEIRPCDEDTWFSVILMLLFNATDLFGKMLAAIQYEWLRSQLFIFACWRIMLIPFLILCAAPRKQPLMSGDGYPIFFCALLGITNGIVGSVPMILAPRRVSEEQRELAGNIMTLSYNVGLTAGALTAYGLEKLLGPPRPVSCNLLHTENFAESSNLIFKTNIHPTLISPIRSTSATTASTFLSFIGKRYPTIATDILQNATLANITAATTVTSTNTTAAVLETLLQ